MTVIAEKNAAYQKRYATTKQGKEARRMANKKFYSRNREELKQRCQRYRDGDRETYLRKQKEYRKTISGHLARVYSNINYRCNNPKAHNYLRYGGRGIRNKFRSMKEFRDYVMDDLKIDPCGLQIDRIDNDGHYERGNIRFVTCKENNNNRRFR